MIIFPPIHCIACGTESEIRRSVKVGVVNPPYIVVNRRRFMGCIICLVFDYSIALGWLRGFYLFFFFSKFELLNLRFHSFHHLFYFTFYIFFFYL